MSVQTHTHIIDGKTLTYQTGNCPLCNPKPEGSTTQKAMGTAYIKGKSAVLHFSKACYITVTYWTGGECYLMSVNEIAKDGANKLVRDGQGKPIWNKITRRMSKGLLNDYIYALSNLVKQIEGGSSAPKRD